ncbi:rhomboid family intramembrane serine protease [Streptomyces durbertensis]|uniref:Rhomboid family intramembrane serine protease n=1 Tax=Streptomyces durbertensis TaxID=2448886 RepID=A0ABR6EJY7_9ACTN|nr:rhomboid family intramembrane serine protease [Streptomyces durbertensis]MBB1245636.1 rhomboid family intramembrane serine protease [Streptomyces durbertensis]
MEHQQGGQGPEQYQLPGCYRHQDRETGIRCTRCERPICPECMIAASVGYQCPECVRGGSGTGHSATASRPRTIAGGTLVGDTKLVTKVLLAINVTVFVAVLATGRDLVEQLSMLGLAAERGPFDPFSPPELLGVADGEWYRLITSAFLHQEFWHIGFNMMALWFLGPPLEAALGRARFLTLYLLSALGGNVLTYWLMEPNVMSLGASGAIFGLFGATAVLMRRMRYDMRPIAVLLGINLVITFVPGLNIAWQAHLGGLVVGAVVAYAMVHAPRERRALVQWGTCALVAVLLLALTVARTINLLG